MAALLPPRSRIVKPIERRAEMLAEGYRRSIRQFDKPDRLTTIGSVANPRAWAVRGRPLRAIGLRRADSEVCAA